MKFVEEPPFSRNDRAETISRQIGKVLSWQMDKIWVE